VKIEISERQPVKVAYLRYTGPYGEPLGRFWRTTVGPWLADHGLVDCPRYGVTLDTPGVTSPECCRYDACVEPPPALTLPDAAETTIPGGRYAVTNFKGTGAEIAAAWDSFIAAALQAGERFDARRHCFEHYPRGAIFDARSGVFCCELCLPLAS
jgi:AraC family transcriptional regulator